MVEVGKPLAMHLSFISCSGGRMFPALQSDGRRTEGQLVDQEGNGIGGMGIRGLEPA